MVMFSFIRSLYHKNSGLKKKKTLLTALNVNCRYNLEKSIIKDFFRDDVTVFQYCNSLLPCSNFTMLPCYNCYHVTILTILQLLPCYNCCYVAIVTMLQLLPCYNCYHVTIVTMLQFTMLQLLPNYNCYHVTIKVSNTSGFYLRTIVDPAISRNSAQFRTIPRN